MQNWFSEIAQLKEILNKTEMQETEKWGIPVFTYMGKNIVGVAGFKKYFTLWFYNGIFLKDEEKKLINANEEKTKALRQWRFFSEEEIDESLILAYVQEAIESEKQEKASKPKKLVMPQMPQLLIDFFESEKEVENAFLKFPPYKQKEYINYISEAKRETTKLSRLEKIKPMILKGKGLNDKYRK